MVLSPEFSQTLKTAGPSLGILLVCIALLHLKKQ